MKTSRGAAHLIIIFLLLILSLSTNLIPIQPTIILSGGGIFPKDAIEWALTQTSNQNILLIGHDFVNRDKWAARFNRPFDIIVLKNREDSSLIENINKVKKCGVLLIDGGDQLRYFDLMKGTPLNNEINKALKRGIVIGGHSAGEAILSEFYFACKKGTVTNEQVDDEKITIERNFFKIPQLKNIIVDSHYSERGREKRLSVFLTRVYKDYKKEIIGIGVNENTALVIDKYGKKRIFGGKTHLVRLERASFNEKLLVQSN